MKIQVTEIIEVTAGDYCHENTNDFNCPHLVLHLHPKLDYFCEHFKYILGETSSDIPVKCPDCYQATKID